MQNSKKLSTYDLAAIGMMAAVCFVATMFLKIGPIPTPAGPTMLKTGNLFCLLAGLLFGGVRGGLAAGIGSALFDLTNPMFVDSAPFTLVFFFLMAFVCGKIAHSHGREAKSTKWNIIAAVAGSLTYMVLHLGKTMIELLLKANGLDLQLWLSGNGFETALITCSTKLITSSINAVFAVVTAVILAPLFRTALIKAGIYQKLWRSKTA
ncbi:ECF transporter S component [Hydrogenoanaerobacterium sp.]|uniref:ECF transporter S component n=1 Tax=Hydrogenoanaerobacterium sp. TaxID=2953763 RepID=UPI00289A4C1B|nr:ECF transporter S component [Hydrogenoanaerobacterium sp.]